jgi:hypothetical protein
MAENTIVLKFELLKCWNLASLCQIPNDHVNAMLRPNTCKCVDEKRREMLVCKCDKGNIFCAEPAALF